jgi:hypothetical protein
METQNHLKHIDLGKSLDASVGGGGQARGGGDRPYLSFPLLHVDFPINS